MNASSRVGIPPVTVSDGTSLQPAAARTRNVSRASNLEPDVSHTLTLAGAGLLAASIMHFVLTPSHMEESRGAGLFFLILGTTQLVVALLLFRNPTIPILVAGIVVNGSATALWVVTRFVPSPFSGETETIDLIGLFVKALEIGSIAALGIALVRESPGPRVKAHQPLRTLAVALVLSIVGGAVLFGAGVAAAAAVPALGEGESHHGGGSEASEDHHESPSPTPGASRAEAIESVSRGVKGDA